VKSQSQNLFRYENSLARASDQLITYLARAMDFKTGLLVFFPNKQKKNFKLVELNILTVKRDTALKNKQQPF
jgi:hypothetical protein